MKKLLLALLLLCAASTCWAASTAREQALQDADRAYREGRYQEAYDGYARLLGPGGAADGHLQYNLGNAAFRLDQIGLAILHYERSRVQLPRDADLKFNLGYAREQIRDVIAAPESFVDTAFFWLGALTLAELFWCFAALNVLFWGIVAVKFFTRAEWASSVLFLLLAAWLLAGASFGLKWRQATTDDRAVILRTEVNVLAGPESRDTLLFKIHEGTVVRLERSEEVWALVRLSDGRRGWLRAEGLERIVAPS